ncbi:alkaline phosphatase D family protein [Caulifigura coniformis]|nr:alkaline phosphatase D family protein [Caulifigura coniformis]
MAWPLLGSQASAFVRSQLRLPSNPFTLGVASGDPSPDGFVLWTRLAPNPLEGGGMPAQNVEVKWEVADDEAMSRPIIKGTTVATPDLAHSVHVEVPGLKPDRWYFYRFTAAGEASPVGRARTAPARGTTPEKLKFAFASCQHWESGLYTAYQHMAKEGLDLVAHLGDYIYEGGPTTKGVRRHSDIESGAKLLTLLDFRNRHAQYKTDEHLQAAHAMCPWLVTWDDHEVMNNYATLISENPKETVEEFASKRAAAYRAYYEHMPLRSSAIPKGPDMQLYRSVSFGGLAEFAVLDTRQYRSDQPCGDGNKPPCPEVFDEKRTILGDTQEKWLYDTLTKSGAKWNILAQQVMVGRLDRTVGEEVTYPLDQWPGYEASRQRLLKHFKANPDLNPVVLTGDIHANFVHDLVIDDRATGQPVVGTEFVGTSISSSGDGVEKRKGHDEIMSENPCMKFMNGERGYVSCEVTPSTWTSKYQVVPVVSKPGGELVTRKTYVVENGRPGAQEA